jgi:hypothetical protein
MRKVVLNWFRQPEAASKFVGQDSVNVCVAVLDEFDTEELLEEILVGT